MDQTVTIIPKVRIKSIDAVRGFALMGILLLHCMEHYDLSYRPSLESPFWQWIDITVRNMHDILFAGKAYAIFSFLFGLSFIIQMNSQAERGIDFRLRFLWRLVILFVLGYVNGLFYGSEFFTFYAIFGVILVPLYKVPSKVLVVLSILLLLQIPQIIDFISLLSGDASGTPTALSQNMSALYSEGRGVFTNGTLWDLFKFNAIKGHTAKMLWNISVYRHLQLPGLFIAGMLVGRSGIHKDPDKMVYWSKKLLPYAIGWFLIFYLITNYLLPTFELERRAMRIGTGLFKTYGNIGLITIYMGGLTLLYYKTIWGCKILDKLAAFGRMSVTNYMIQSIIGVFIFYGFGLGLAKQSYLTCFLIGVAILLIQTRYSNWWFKRFYYGPMEWLWRSLTWFRKAPMKRKGSTAVV